MPSSPHRLGMLFRAHEARTQNPNAKAGQPQKGKMCAEHLAEHELRAQDFFLEKHRAARQAGQRPPTLLRAAREIGEQLAKEDGRKKPYGRSTIIRWLGSIKELLLSGRRETLARGGRRQWRRIVSCSSAPSVSPPPDPDAMFATGSIYANVETHSDEAFAKVASAISERWAQATDPDYQIKKLLADVSHVLRHDPPYPDGIREDANIAGLNANMLRHALETQADRKSIAWLALEAGYRWAQFDARVRYEPAVRKPKEDRRKKGNTPQEAPYRERTPRT